MASASMSCATSENCIVCSMTIIWRWCTTLQLVPAGQLCNCSSNPSNGLLEVYWLIHIGGSCPIDAQSCLCCLLSAPIVCTSIVDHAEGVRLHHASCLVELLCWLAHAEYLMVLLRFSGCYTGCHSAMPWLRNHCRAASALSKTASAL